MYGHSSMLHPDTGRIYIHGGYRMLNSTCFKTSDKTIYYQPNRKEWYFRHSSGVPRYLHSTVLVGGTMIVLGGRGDSALVSHQLMLFDVGKSVIDCIHDSSRISTFSLLLSNVLNTICGKNANLFFFWPCCRCLQCFTSYSWHYIPPLLGMCLHAEQSGRRETLGTTW